MSAATFTDPSPSAETLTLPPEMWRCYRTERQMGSKQREATSHVFDKFPAYQKSDTRERLALQMIQREAAHGLTLSPEEYEAELAADAERAAAEAFPPEPGSMEAIERDAAARVIELRARIEHMSPESLSDAKVAAEQRDAESQLHDAERELATVERARREVGRRDVDAAERAEAERRAAATAEAAKLEPVILKLKDDVDRKAVEWVEGVVVLRDAIEARAAQVAAAMPNDAMALRSARFREGDIASSLRHALRGRIRIDALEAPGRTEPLVAAEPGSE